jgi:hypothetical protein
MRSTVFTRPLAVVAFASTLVAGATPAWAANHGKPGGGGGGSTALTGIDVSYPQCPGTSLPSGEAFAIVGVNGGLANDYNSCLNAEFAYAQQSAGGTKQAPAQLYLNTADPGNGVADWPSPSQLGAYGSTSTPAGTCGYASGTSGPGANSPGCAYIYGYDMVAGIRYNGGTIAGDVSDFQSATGRALAAYPVWLDVETGNSWQPATTSGGLAMNVADLQGMVAAIKASDTQASPNVGVYSTSYQWNQITGTPTGTSLGNLAALPDWIPGATKENGAVSNCSLTSFTGGQVTVTQWAGRPYDGDYSCIG